MIVNLYVEAKNQKLLDKALNTLMSSEGIGVYDATNFDPYCKNPSFYSLETIEAALECK